MKIRIEVDLSEVQVNRLIRRAILYGFKKLNERNQWTDKDKREAVRYIMTLEAEGPR